jgi:tetratricopeptide (TPR) repeat protein
MLEHQQKLAAARESKAEGKLKEQLKSDPTDPEQYLRASSNLRKAGKWEEAAELLSGGLAATGNDFRLQVELAEAELDPFRHDLSSTERQLQSRPDDPELVRHRVRLLKEVNARETDLYRMKADRYPGEWQHRLELGVRLLRAGQTDEAITELQAARKDERLAAKAAMYLGHCFKARNNWRLAERNFEEALRRLPPNDEATRKDVLYQLATGSADAGDLGKAVDMAHELANLDFGYRNINRLLDEWQAKLQKA